LRFGFRLARPRRGVDGTVALTGGGGGAPSQGSTGAGLDDDDLLDDLDDLHDLHEEPTATAFAFVSLDIRQLAVLIEAAFDHLQGQKGVSLLAQDPAQTLDVSFVKLPVARRGALRVD
jgi:hypothetical protein